MAAGGPPERGAVIRRFPLIALLAALACGPGEETLYDFVLVGGTVIDGSGSERRQADVAIVGDRIVRVAEQIPTSAAAQSLDVSGLIVAPGFWDNHAHLVELEDRPIAENFLRQGISTIIGSLHSQEQVHPMDEYRQRVEMAPNVGLFAGHTWIRERVIGLEDREPSPRELEEMEALVEAAMEDGALGLATGLEYVPAVYAGTDEIVALAEVAARFGGIYVTHMRDEGPGVIESVRETLEIGRRAGLPVQINHHKVVGAAHFGWTERTLALIDEAIASGQRVAHDVYPYTAYSTYSDLMFPPWALAGGAAYADRVADPETHARLVAEMRTRFLEQTGAGPETIRIREMATRPELAGRTLAEHLMDEGQEPTIEAAVDELIQLQLAGGFIGIFHGMDEDDVRRVMRHREAMFETDGDLVEPGVGHPHPRSYGSFPRILGKYVREEGVLSLEEAIHKMTGMPAAWWGQADRGLIREGLLADVLVFDAERVGDRSEYTDPHHHSVGIVHLFVNGVPVLMDETVTGKMPGRFLDRRREAP